MMRTATIPYRNGQLHATKRDDAWAVRLENLEVRARYLDLALAQLLGNASEAHRAAARLLGELADIVEQQQAAGHPVPQAPRKPRNPRRPKLSAKPLLLGGRVFVFAVVASTAFVLTTWLSTLR